MKTILHHLTAASLFLAAMSAPALAQGNLGADFTYQAKIALSGTPITGTADFQFRLFDAATGGIQIGTMFAVSNANIVDGLVSAPLNFGASAFNGDARFLEIAVRSPANTGNFITLTPRQRITGAPYALKVPGIDGHSLNSANGQLIDALYVNGMGNVGIGATTPVGRLDVRSGNNSYFRIDDYRGDIHVNGGTESIAAICHDAQGVQSRLDVVVNGDVRMAIEGTGYVGVGTTTPYRRFTVKDPGIYTARFEGDSPYGALLELHNENSNATWEWGVTGNVSIRNIPVGSMYLYRQGNVDIPLVIENHGWVGFGVMIPGYRIDLPNIADKDGRGRANRWDTYSSARWKHNVQPIESALDKVMQLRGVTFDWNAENGGAHDVGFIAEEVGAIVPELVTWEPDGKNAQGLAYDRITALTVEAIKDQQKQIDELRRSNAQLQAMVEALLARDSK